MHPQEKLAGLLKHKGIGPESSKSLSEADLQEVTHLMFNDEVSATTKATMLTALLTLSPNEHEAKWVYGVRTSPEKYIPEFLFPFIKGAVSPLQKLTNQVIAGHDLSHEEGQQGMSLVLDTHTPDYLKGAFLEAERLKRETFTENAAFYTYLQEQITPAKANVPSLVDICDSYDGCNRVPTFSLFTAALLASAGYPAYLHGIDAVAPKEGVTAHQVLKLAGKNPARSIDAVVADLENPEIGWGYIDQSVYFPAMYANKQMRKEMIKRPYLATWEKLLQPIRGNASYVITAYTHTAYKEEVIQMLAKHGNCQKSVLLKGLEATCQPFPGKTINYMFQDNSQITEKHVESKAFLPETPSAKQFKGLQAEHTFQEGLSALSGEQNTARNQLLLNGAFILYSFFGFEPAGAIQLLSEKIDSGAAMAHWTYGCA